MSSHLKTFVFPLRALNHPEEFKPGERNSSYYPSDLGNLPAVIEQIFCEKSWWAITALIRSAWAGSVVRVDGRAWCLQVLASGSNICCYYLTGAALRYDSASLLLRCSDAQRGNCLRDQPRRNSCCHRELTGALMCSSGHWFTIHAQDSATSGREWVLFPVRIRTIFILSKKKQTSEAEDFWFVPVRRDDVQIFW